MLRYFNFIKWRMAILILMGGFVVSGCGQGVAYIVKTTSLIDSGVYDLQSQSFIDQTNIAHINQWINKDQVTQMPVSGTVKVNADGTITPVEVYCKKNQGKVVDYAYRLDLKKLEQARHERRVGAPYFVIPAHQSDFYLKPDRFICGLGGSR